MVRLCAALLFFSSLAFARDLPAYRQWISDCARLPSNRELRGTLPDRTLLPLPTFADFETALDGFLALAWKGEISEKEKWVDGAPEPAVFFDITRSWLGGKEIPFQPFAAKLVLPPDSTAIAIGDLHGDIRSFLQMLEELNRRKILDGFAVREPTWHLIFTGDFTDRGSYGTEVLYTLFRLKMASPAQVHIARGNHEDFDLASRYGFLDELRGKYGQDANITKLMRAYDLLPVVVYLGTGKDFLQINHGGMEPGFDPRALLAAPGNTRFQLLRELKQKTYDQARPGWLGEDPAVRELAAQLLADFTPETPSTPRMIGFIWNDFTVFRDEPQLGYLRSLVYGPVPTRRILADASTNEIRLRGVIRAHQHSAELSPLMSRLVACGGVYRHWQRNEDSSHAGHSVEAIRNRLRPGNPQPLPNGSVWTLNVSPDSVYGMGCGFDFAAAAVLNLAPEFEDWRISTLTLDVNF
jgi:Calcineurin-like phosphoesterase